MDAKTRERTTLDLIASYTFNLRAPVAQQEVPGFAKDGGKNMKTPDSKEKNVLPTSEPPIRRAWMARLVEWHDDHSRDAERVRFGSAIRRRRLRVWLRPIPCRRQRPVLVRPANEKILVALLEEIVGSLAQGNLTGAQAADL